MVRLDAYLKVVTNLIASALRRGLSFSLELCRPTVDGRGRTVLQVLAS